MVLNILSIISPPSNKSDCNLEITEKLFMKSCAVKVAVGSIQGLTAVSAVVQKMDGMSRAGKLFVFYTQQAFLQNVQMIFTRLKSYVILYA